MGSADIILDLVSTGVTLRENNLKQIEGGTIMHSEGALVANRQALLQRKVRRRPPPAPRLVLSLLRGCCCCCAACGGELGILRVHALISTARTCTLPHPTRPQPTAAPCTTAAAACRACWRCATS